MGNPSPLRYPGGKYKISRLIEHLIGKAGDQCAVYIEPFAGGAGVALDLLNRNVVSEIVINDSDKAIASFWKAVIEENDAFVDKIYSTPVTIDEWKKQRDVYLTSKRCSFEYGFATFFLNRTNHSGILSSGPIGGQAQEMWKLDVRFNKPDLIHRIQSIGKLRRRIHIFNRDVNSLIANQVKRYENRAFIYFDPPYYTRGSVLYQNFFTDKLHKKLCLNIKENVKSPWAVSYDDVPEIREIYDGVPSRTFSLNYSLANNGRGKEIMFFSPGLMPSSEEIFRIGMGAMFGVEKDRLK
ncbi:MAG: DNA adenine methylase [Candidatus Spyradosoma sp.]